MLDKHYYRFGLLQLCTVWESTGLWMFSVSSSKQFCVPSHIVAVLALFLTSNNRTAVRSVCSCKTGAWSSLSLGFQTVPQQEAFH